MSWDEKLFGLASRAVRRLTTPREDPDVVAAAVELETVQRRIELLARLLGGRDLEVRAAEDHGGCSRDTLRVPAHVAATTDRTRNLRLLLHRVAVAVIVRDHDLWLPTIDGPDAARLGPLASLLWARRVEAELAARFPGGHSLTRCAHCSARELLLRRARRDDWLACLELAVLDCQPETLAAHFRSDLVEWTRFRLRTPTTPEQCLQDARELLRELPRSARPSRLRPSRLHLAPWGRLDRAPTDRQAPDEDRAADSEPPRADDALPRGDTERRARIRERVTERRTRDDERGDSPLIHVFEKLLTAEEYQGGNRREDGEDELDEHGDALDELDLRQVVRSDTRTSSIYRADVEGLGPAPELGQALLGGERELYYDEWHDASRSYRPMHCRLRVQRAGAATHDPAAGAWARRIRQRHARTIREVRADLARLDRNREPRLRQRSGDDIDLDAVVDHLVAVRAARNGHGHTAAGSERLYIARRPARIDLATTVLLDTSLSTDAWVDDRRVLDTAREAVVLLGAAFGEHEMPVAVAAFHSHSRRDCRYVELKTADEPWSAAHSRLWALRPTGYTRIGPALRHATRDLADSPARRRLLVLVSDGKPTDHDHYEGKHGIADVRQALREARRERVTTYALAIDRTARGHLTRMFGAGGYGILAEPAGLPQALLGLRARLLGHRS